MDMECWLMRQCSQKVPIIGIDCKDFYGAFKNRLIFDNKINLKKTLLPNLEIELLIQVKKLLNDQEYNNKNWY